MGLFFFLKQQYNRDKALILLYKWASYIILPEDRSVLVAPSNLPASATLPLKHDVRGHLVGCSVQKIEGCFSYIVRMKEGAQLQVLMRKVHHV